VVFTRYSVMESRSAAQVLVEEKCVYAGKFGGLCCKGTDHLDLPPSHRGSEAQQTHPTAFLEATTCLRKQRGGFAHFSENCWPMESLKAVPASFFETSLC
jgi:hypothetical protein